MTTVQLDAEALHKVAKDPDAYPAEFSAANRAVADTDRAYHDAVQARYALIRQARRLGVSYVALSRWTGLNTRTLYDISEGKG